jgi:hypothetical protein
MGDLLSSQVGRALQIALPIGMGDLLFARGQLDTVAGNYPELQVGFATKLLGLRSADYRSFATAFARLLFSEAPYHLGPALDDPVSTPLRLLKQYGAEPTCPRLAPLLCLGHPPRLGRPYLVLHTKVRALDRTLYLAVRDEFLDLLVRLSQRYTLVLLGERELEPHADYQRLGSDFIYSIYRDLVTRLPLQDRTFAGFGSPPDRLAQLQHDCCVMRDAALSIHMGMGGAFCLAAAVGRVLSYRDGTPFFFVDRAFGEEQQPNGLVTRHWPRFRAGLEALGT